jgi:hypothetical protein
MCVRILTLCGRYSTAVLLYTCPHTAVCVPAYCGMCVRIRTLKLCNMQALPYCYTAYMRVRILLCARILKVCNVLRRMLTYADVC